jgi:hypothetical protein
LQLDLDADYIAGLADAAAVSSWADRSGQGLDVAQATGSKQPTYRVGVLNGRPVVRFAGTDDILVRSGAPPFTGQAGSVFAVVNLVATTGHIVSSGDEGAGTDRLSLLVSSGKLRLVVQVGGSANSLDGDTTLSTGVTYVVSAHSTGSAYSSYVNGVLQTLTVLAGSNDGTWWGDLTLLDNLTVGALKVAAEASFLTGDIGRVLVYDQALAAGERTRIERWLGQRYGVVL